MGVEVRGEGGIEQVRGQREKGKEAEERKHDAKYCSLCMEAGRDELITTCCKTPNKQKNPTPNKGAWLPFNSQSNSEEILGLLMMRKPNISSSQVCSKSRGRGSVMTRLVRDHLACSNHQSLGLQRERIQSRDEQGATRIASCSVQCKQPVHLGTSCSCTLEWGRNKAC